MTNLDDAIALAEAGYSVFPIHAINEDGICTCLNPKCPNAAKHPLTGSGFLDATVNIRTIRGWFERWPFANIGIATGERSGIVVLDIDGSAGYQSLGSLPLPNTPSVATGRVDGGIHYYFKWPGYAIKSAIKIESGLDIRGDGGYVIAPPSIHKTGNKYYWVTAPINLNNETIDKAELADIPDWLLPKLSKPKAGSEAGEPDTDNPRMIGEGMRDVELTSMAGVMRRKGFNYAAIRLALLEHNSKYCKPPLEEDQVEKIAHSVSTRYQGTSSRISVTIFDEELGEIEVNQLAREAKLSDVGNAEVFVDLFGDRFRYDHARKKWMVWVDGVGAWREDISGYSERAFMSTLRTRDVAALSLMDDKAKKDLRNWVSTSESKSGIPNGLKRASNLKGIPIATAQFDADPILLNTAQGTLNLDTGEFYPPQAGDFLSRQSPVIYDSSAKAPRWEQFINEVFEEAPDMVQYVQRALGYTLSGLTKEQSIFVAHGNGANGKSTLLNTVKRVMGDYAASTPFDTFEADSRNQYGNDLAALKGRRYVIASESEASRRLAEARVKLVTGQDPITCRFLYGEFFEYIPQFKVWLAVNHKPIIKGTDLGIWRRIHLIPFNVTFGENGRYMDKDLDLKLAEELPGILNWLITGYTYWKNHELNPPDVVQEATAEYKRENDHVELWLSDRVTKEPSAELSATEAYSDFRNYLEEIGEVNRGIPTMKAWSISMVEKGYDKKRTSKGYFYAGIKLPILRLSDRGN